MQKLAKWLVAASCLAAIVGAFASGQRQGSPAVAILALIGSIGVELQATPLAVGYFSPSPAIAIALTALPQVGLAWALACVACGIVARVLVFPPSSNGQLADLTVDFVPAAVAAWATVGLGLAGATPVYLLVALPLPRLLSKWFAPLSKGAGKTRASLVVEHIGLVSLGPTAALLARQHVALVLLVLPCVKALLRAATTQAELSQRRSEHTQIRAARSELQFQEKQLSQNEQRQFKLQRLLDARAETFVLLETLSARSFSQKQALEEALNTLHDKLGGAECLYIAAGPQGPEFHGAPDVFIGLQRAWRDQEPWFHISPNLSRTAFPLSEGGLVLITAETSLSPELQHTLRVFFFYLNVMLERVRFHENLVQALNTEAALRKELSVAVTRLHALLVGAGELARLVLPADILQLAVDRATHWTGRPAAARYGLIAIGVPDENSQPLPLAGGDFRIAAGLDESEIQALQLWLVLVGGALERCQAQAGLMQSSKLAAIGQLAAGVAHELNTPLGSISMAIGLVERNLQKNPDKARSHLEITRKSIGQMRSIVSKLLDYSREATGDERRTVSLAEIARDSLQLIEQSFRLEKVELLSRLEEVLVQVNAGEIQQVLVNLLVNARLAAAGGVEPKVTLSVARQQNQAEVQVSDNGPGVPVELVARIFEPFFTTRDVGSGVGLGLSISREIVAAHGGELSYHGREGGGACFTFTLPVAEEDHQ